MLIFLAYQVVQHVWKLNHDLGIQNVPNILLRVAALFIANYIRADFLIVGELCYEADPFNPQNVKSLHNRIDIPDFLNNII